MSHFVRHRSFFPGRRGKPRNAAIRWESVASEGKDWRDIQQRHRGAENCLLLFALPAWLAPLPVPPRWVHKTGAKTRVGTAGRVTQRVRVARRRRRPPCAVPPATSTPPGPLVVVEPFGRRLKFRRRGSRVTTSDLPPPPRRRRPASLRAPCSATLIARRARQGKDFPGTALIFHNLRCLVGPLLMRLMLPDGLSRWWCWW